MKMTVSPEISEFAVLAGSPHAPPYRIIVHRLRARPRRDDDVAKSGGIGPADSDRASVAGTSRTQLHRPERRSEAGH